jgi:hypothetical protein
VYLVWPMLELDLVPGSCVACQWLPRARPILSLSLGIMGAFIPVEHHANFSVAAPLGWKLIGANLSTERLWKSVRRRISTRSTMAS